MTLLSIKNLSLFVDKKFLFENVSFSIKNGEIIGLVGPSGSGKSSIANAILRLRENFSATGKIIFENKDLLKLNEYELEQIRGKKISFIFQDPLTSLNPLQTIGNQIKESLDLKYKKTTKQQVFDLMQLVELKNVKNIYSFYPHQLSGGQKQRVLIAIALTQSPSLLIADEPTTALDTSTQKQIILTLKKIQKKLNLSILFITHDIDLIKNLSSKVYSISEKKFINKNTLNSSYNFKIPLFLDKEILTVSKLSVFYKNKEVVHPTSFSLRKREILGIVGESGSGKTSLCKAICKLLKAQGSVFINNIDFLNCSSKNTKNIRSKIQILFQTPISSLNPRKNIRKTLLEPLQIHFPYLTKIQKYRKIIQIIQDTNLSKEILRKYPCQISGGEAVRVALARCLLVQPEILIFDELTSSLDVKTKINILNLLLELQKKYEFSYILISHDIKTMINFCHSLFVMKNGRFIDRINSNTPKINYHPYTLQLFQDSVFSDIK